MANYCVQIDKVQAHIDELEEICNSLIQCRVKVESVCNSSINHHAGYEKVKKTLGIICKGISEEERAVKGMKDKLQDVITSYITTEQKLCNNIDNEIKNRKKEENNSEDEIINPENMSYEEYLQYRYENAVDENTRLLYEKYIKKIRIKDDSYEGTAHYNFIWNHIKYDSETDATNRRGIGCTYYHEVGHLIDDQSDWNSHTSTDWSYDFYDKLNEDVNNWVKNIMIEQGYTDIDDAYDYVSEWLRIDGDNKNGISDLIYGLTDGAAYGFWAHDIDYYSSSSIPKEAFAHFFEAGMSADNTKLEYIKKIFPNAYKEYQKMIEDELE